MGGARLKQMRVRSQSAGTEEKTTHAGPDPVGTYRAAAWKDKTFPAPPAIWHNRQSVWIVTGIRVWPSRPVERLASDPISTWVW